jgi:hypothetical protein
VHFSLKRTFLLEQQPQRNERFAGLEQQVWALAEQHVGDPESLLKLLRLLEHLHRQIQEGPFRDALPTNRQALYSLLRDMEVAGGWPYIPRLQLRTFMELLQGDSENVDWPLDKAS